MNIMVSPDDSQSNAAGYGGHLLNFNCPGLQMALDFTPDF
jgi:hypothetical protein